MESLFNEIAVLKPLKFLKKRPQHKNFLIKFAKFLRALSFTEHLWWLIFEMSIPHNFDNDILSVLISCYLSLTIFLSSKIYFRQLLLI